MARPKAKFHKSNRRITPTDILWDACREDIDNFSAFFDACLKNHLKSRIKNDPKYKSFLFDKFGDDLFFILKSSSVDINESRLNQSAVSAITDDELNSLVEGL